MSQKYTIRFTAPYSGIEKFQTFDSLEKAKRMIAFYSKCGTVATLV